MEVFEECFHLIKSMPQRIKADLKTKVDPTWCYMYLISGWVGECKFANMHDCIGMYRHDRIFVWE